MPLQFVSFGNRDIEVPACSTAPCRHYYRQDPDWVQDIEERLAYPEANENLWEYFFSLLGPLSLNPYCAQDWKGRDPRLQRCHRIVVKEGFVKGMKQKAERTAEVLLGRRLQPGDYVDDPYLWHLFAGLGIMVDLDAELAMAEVNF
jgi:hypothetical protein